MLPSSSSSSSSSSSPSDRFSKRLRICRRVASSSSTTAVKISIIPFRVIVLVMSWMIFTTTTTNTITRRCRGSYLGRNIIGFSSNFSTKKSWTVLSAVASASSLPIPPPSNIFFNRENDDERRKRSTMMFHSISLSSTGKSIISTKGQLKQQKFPYYPRGGGGNGVVASYNSTISNDTVSTRSFSSDNSDVKGNVTTATSANPTATTITKNQIQQREDVDSSTAASIETTTTKPRFLKRGTKLIRKTVGGIFSAVGFVASSFIGIDPLKVHKRTKQPLMAFQKYLKQTGIDQELASALRNRFLGRNLLLLLRIQQQQKQQIDSAASNKQKQQQKRQLPTVGLPSRKQFWSDAQRYMRYATAVYGQAMIHAAQIDAKGMLDVKWGDVTLDSIARHVGITKKDIVWMKLQGNDNDNKRDDKDDDDLHHLKHFVAIDHKHKTVVLAIRGTFSMEDIVVDVTAYSNEFCKIGEAHSEMAIMAERVWEQSSPTIKNLLLRKHPNYKLVVTGHSLGAGTACLLNILIHTQKLLPPNQLDRVQCFAYASPPVFTPLEFIPRNCFDSTYNFIHQDDCVPFLSVYSIRRLLVQLSQIHDYAKSRSNNLSTRKCAKIILGIEPPPEGLMKAITSTAATKAVKPKQGAPQLEIPACMTIWFHETTGTDDDDDDDAYSYECFSPKDIVGYPFPISPNMMTDHLPPRYEHAFDHLKQE